MSNCSQKVELVMANRPGSLDRVLGQIRREGWNIKSLQVAETDDPRVSQLEMYIEGTHTKLAQT